MIKIYSTQNKTVSEFAKHVSGLINESVAKDKNFYLALSGGNTAQLLFKHLKKKYLDIINWSQVHIFWGDERCVPPESEESNYGYAFKLFLQHTNIPEENIHRIHGEANEKIEAKRYSGEILMNVPTKNKLPKFDLIILGLGSDGHTASIFPDQMNLLESENICEVAVHPQTKQKRITLTGNIINNAANISFLVTGIEKAEVLADIINMKKNYKKYPGSYINPKNGKLVWYLDKSVSKFL